MHGDLGWTYRTENEGTDESMMKHACYRAQIRDGLQSDIIYDILLHGHRLMHQYWVDQWMKIEEQRLNFIRFNQQKLKADTYKGITDAVSNGETNVGDWIILPSSHIGSPRNNVQNYQDVIAISRKFGKSDIFITFTCNPKWTEIISSLKENEQSWMRPDLTTRVFKVKLAGLLQDISKRHVLGKVVAQVHVVEFQKRGLPHAHILVWFKNEDKPRTTEDYDRIICAEIPDFEKNPNLFETVTTQLIHGPCGFMNPKCVCMINRVCSKYFPKEFCSATTAQVDGYPVYRRRSPREGGRVFTKDNGDVIDNSWVVPYNPYLTAKYDAHINVEICNTVQAIKYLFKYVYKGHISND
jgi:hypothetical protein